MIGLGSSQSDQPGYSHYDYPFKLALGSSQIHSILESGPQILAAVEPWILRYCKGGLCVGIHFGAHTSMELMFGVKMLIENMRIKLLRSHSILESGPHDQYWWL
jgi:hypothetical protein